MGTTKAIIFDVYNTLLDLEVDEERQDSYVFLSRWLSYQGIRITPPDLRSLYLDLCRREISKSNQSYPDVNIGRVFRQILQVSLGSRCEIYQIADSGRAFPPKGRGVARRLAPEDWLVAEFARLFRILTTDRLSIFPGVLAMLDALKGKVKLGITSNSQRLFTVPEFEKFGIGGYFDAVVFSSDVGACKPDPKIFSAVLDALSALPEEAIFVGDNPVADVYGAGSVGMKTVWIDRARPSGTLIDFGPVKPDYIARDEWALAEILLAL